MSKKKMYFSDCFGVVGIVIETRDEQGESISSRIVVTTSEMMVSVVDEHLENVFLSMAITSKSAIESRKQHEQNANCLITETLFSELLQLINGYTRKKSLILDFLQFHCQ